MPITLVTGLPGHGKTLYTLARWKDEAEKAGRPVFHNGIKGLKLPWTQFDPEKWEDLPAGSLVVIDEAQFTFPVRGRGQPPAWIEKLATHRHLGLDFVLVTQNPMLIDSFVRRLVDRHFHVVRKFGTHMATIHEFPNGVKENVATSREGSVRHEWRYPKSVFDLYTSAELHTVKRRIPARVWLLFAMPVIFGALVWYGYQRLKPDAAAERMGAEVPQDVQPLQPVQPRQASSRSSAQAPMTQAEYLASYQPRIPGLAYTAPRYDALTVPVRVPTPSACVATASRCQCYTEDATRLDVPDDLCRRFVERGHFLDFQGPAPIPLADGPAPLPQATPRPLS